MKLEFMYLPTQDLDAALALYRDTLGFDELWREGELTVGLGTGTEVALMIDAACGRPASARARSSSPTTSRRSTPSTTARTS